MKKYAMILLNCVVDIVSCDSPPCYPPDMDGNTVDAVECDETVEVGMYYFDGKFIVLPPIIEPNLTQEQQLMQCFVDSELRDLVIQQNQELLAQLMTDIELVVLGGNAV